MSEQVDLFTDKGEGALLTLYVPHDWLDEVSPTPSEEPATFAEKQPDGSWHLRPAEDDELRDQRSGIGGLVYDLHVVPGMIVPFAEHRNYRNVELTVHEDRTFTVCPPIPEDANCVYADGDWEAMTDNVEDLVSGCGDNDCALRPGTYSLANYYWGGPVRFRFDIKDGKPTFERVTVQ